MKVLILCYYVPEDLDLKHFNGEWTAVHVCKGVKEVDKYYLNRILNRLVVDIDIPLLEEIQLILGGTIQKAVVNRESYETGEKYNYIITN